MGELRDLGAAERNELLGSADLGDFFWLSDEAKSKSADALEEALALAKLREERTRILNLSPARIVDQSLMAIDLVGRSVAQFGEPPKFPAEDLLRQAWDKIRERLRCSGYSGSVWSVAFSSTEDRILSGSDDSTLRLWRGGTWEDWLRDCCDQLMFHSSLVAPETAYAHRACQVCLDRVWTKGEQARFHRAQGYYLQRQGDTTAAQAKFAQAQAQALDPTIEIEP